MGDGLKRYNHATPCMYLRRFASPEAKVFSYRLLVPDARYPQWTSHSPSALAAQENLYVRLSDEGETDELERWLGREFESPAEAEIERAVTQQPITKEGWKRLIRFALLQDIRTPARLLELMPKWMEFTHQTMVDFPQNAPDCDSGIKILGTSRLTTPGEQLEKDLNLRLLSTEINTEYPLRVSMYQHREKQGGYIRLQVSVGRWMWHYAIRHVMTNTFKAFINEKWTILRAPEGVRWFTSDDPLVRVHVDNNGRTRFGGGYRLPGTIIFLPLDPEHLLFTTVGERLPPRNTVVQHAFALKVQQWIFQHGHRSIFSDRPEPNLSGRTVNKEIFEDERAQWLTWHEDQLNAESDLLNRTPTG